MEKREETKCVGSLFVACRRWTERLTGSRASYLYSVASGHESLSRVTKQWSCLVTALVIFPTRKDPMQTHF